MGGGGGLVCVNDVSVYMCRVCVCGGGRGVGVCE